MAAAGVAPDAAPSPTPVLDALEASLTNGWNDTVGGANARLLEDISKVDIYSFEEEHDPVDMFLDEPFPEPDAELACQPMWVECGTRITHAPGDVPVRTAVLFEQVELDGGRGTDTWPWTLISARFVLLVPSVEEGEFPMICPARFITDAYRPSSVEGLLSECPLAEFERIRFGLQRAATATDDQLLQMATNILEVGGKFLHGIPTDRVPTSRPPLPRYSQAAESGFEGLRMALATTCLEQWDPYESARIRPELSYDPLFSSVVLYGPFVALRLMEAVAQSLPITKSRRRTEETLPEPFARGRKAIRLGARR